MGKIGVCWTLCILLVIIVNENHHVRGVDFKVIGDSVVTEAEYISNGAPENAPTKANILKTVKVGSKESVEPTSSDEKLPETTTAPGAGSLDNESWGDAEISGPGKPIPELSGSDLVTSYPWLASIQLDKKQVCTGTLINKQFILTTAFCMFQLSPSELSELEIDIGFQAIPIVKFRQYELTKGPYVTSKVKRSIRHLRFSPTTGYNDIALLQLITPIVAGESVKPIELSQENDVQTNVVIQHIIGWRNGQDLNGDEVEYWRNQPSQGVSLENCRKGYADILDPQGISPAMLCSGGDTDATSCRWKFGTPLVEMSNSTEEIGNNVKAEMKQIGIFSWGSEALLPECRFSLGSPTPLVFTRTSSYTEWIQRNIKQFTILS